MKILETVSFISLIMLLASCQSEEKNTPPASAAKKGGWKIYPPLSALSDSQKAKLHLPPSVTEKIKADSARDAQTD